MNTHEWALLIFTTLGQLAVGMMLVLLVVRTYAVRKAGVEEAARLTDVPFYSIVPIMGLAMLASLFHLGKLVNVVGALPNLSTSWMSREVVFGVAFIVLVALFAILLWRKVGSEMLHTVTGWVTVLTGLGFILCMGMTYMLPAQPAWNNWATPINFYVTTLLLGVLGSAVALMVNYTWLLKKAAVQQGLIATVLERISISAIVLLGIEFLVLPMYLAFLSTQGPAAVETLKLMIGTYGAMFAIRLLFVFIGAGVLAAYLHRNASLPGQEKSWATLVYSAFVLVLISEAMGRFIFYAAHVRIGI